MPWNVILPIHICLQQNYLQSFHVQDSENCCIVQQNSPNIPLHPLPKHAQILLQVTSFCTRHVVKTNGFKPFSRLHLQEWGDNLHLHHPLHLDNDRASSLLVKYDQFIKIMVSEKSDFCNFVRTVRKTSKTIWTGLSIYMGTNNHACKFATN